MSVDARVESSPVGLAISVEKVQLPVKESVIVGVIVFPREYIETDELVNARRRDDVSVNCPPLVPVVKGAVRIDEVLPELKGHV